MRSFLTLIEVVTILRTSLPLCDLQYVGREGSLRAFDDDDVLITNIRDIFGVSILYGVKKIPTV